MEAAAVVGGEATKCAFAHLEREVGYLVHFRRNVNNLNNKVQQLSAKKQVVERQILEASNNDEEIIDAVVKWPRKVDVVQTEATQLINEARQITRWFNGWFCSRFRLGRKAHKQIDVIQQLLDDKSVQVVSFPKPAQSLELVCAEDFNVYASRAFSTNKIKEALLNKNNNLVGVFGMPGIGKTKLIEAISKQMKETKLFEEVVTVTVSENPDVKTIQKNIARELDLHLDENDSISFRAKRLQGRLMSGKKILIVLDDLWRKLELAEVGIPCNNNSSNQGCMIIFTTRNKDVCSEMLANEQIEVEVLSNKDSWHLFRQKAGDVVEDPHVKPFARQVLKKAKGLPLAIVTFGTRLRDKDAIVWENALTQLKKSIYKDMQPVELAIKFSYNFLECEVTKICFLFCCMFPEDFDIDLKVLVVYLMGENMLKDVENLVEARIRLHAKVSDLRSSSLLLKSYTVGCIKMHDVVRDVAISIASQEEEIKVEAGKNLTRWPEELKNCRRLSLMSTKINCHTIPDQVEAPLLLTLSLSGFKDLNELPHDFFKNMKKLMNLDLSNTDIEALPQSISCLVELRTLRMLCCNYIYSLSPVENLEKLQILDLDGSSIQSVPEEMGRLTSLKSLTLSASRSLVISPVVISRMCRLEELYASSFNGWETVEMGNKTNASLLEVASLATLTCLEIRIPNLECFSSTPIHWENLKECVIFVTGHVSNPNPYYSMNFYDYSRQFRKRLYLELPSVSVPQEVKRFLGLLDCLWLLYCKGIESVVYLDPWELGNKLRCLRVIECGEMKYLMSSIGGKEIGRKAFSKLEELHFEYLDNFVAICDVTTPLPQKFLQNLKVLELRFCKTISTLISAELLVGLKKLEEIDVYGCPELERLIHTTSGCSWSRMSTFSNLRSLRIDGCKKVTYVFPMRVARQLNWLEKLAICDCASMKMIIANDGDENDDEDKVILPQLKILSLYELPELLSFSRQGLVFDWPSLEELTVEMCENLKSFPCRVTKRLRELKYLVFDSVLLNLLEDSVVLADYESFSDNGGSFYRKKVEG